MAQDIAKQKTLDMYASLMEEVKLREATVWEVIAGEITLPHPASEVRPKRSVSDRRVSDR